MKTHADQLKSNLKCGKFFGFEWILIEIIYILKV